MVSGDGGDVRMTSKPEESGRQLRGRSSDDAITRIGLEMNRNLFRRDFDGMVYWLIAYASFADIEPSSHVRMMLARFLTREVLPPVGLGGGEPSRGQDDGT